MYVCRPESVSYILACQSVNMVGSRGVLSMCLMPQMKIPTALQFNFSLCFRGPEENKHPPPPH